MAFSPANEAPSIRVFESGCFPLPGRGTPSLPRPTVAMAIPNARSSEAPPPLIPDRHIGKQIQRGDDAGWKWGNSPSNNTFGGIKPGSSLLGGHASQPRASVSRSLEELDLNTMDVDSDEEGAQQRTRASRPLESGGQPIRLAPVANPASRNAYDRQILSKINSLSSTTPGTPNHATPPRLSVSTQEPTISRTESPRLSVSAQDTAVLPLRRQSEAVPGFWRSKSGPISPACSFRSPSVAEGELAPQSFHRHRGSYDHSVFSESECGVEDTAMRDPFHRGRSPAGSDEYRHGSTAGQKRRASSPPAEAARDDRAMGNGSAELYHRRGTLTLIPPASPMQRRCTANPGSYSSASSFPSQRQSLGSSLNTFSGASSMTSYNGDQLLSPGTLPSSAEPDGSISPYAASRSLDPSPRCSLSHRTGLSEHEHQHQARGIPSDSIHFIRQGSVAGQMSGTWVCECCPKKPKKFDNEAELRVHESEKQYTCQYCPNRFKNKNEAERHQNSLHIRQFSWSCAALADASAAFHPSNPAPSATDACGYCGQEFKNPPDWQERREHLNLSHKYGECNKVKKFYRADHFRQHLKHTHAGTSGKWTNHLENACMQNEEPPAKMQKSSGSSPTTPLAPKPNGETGP